MDYAKLKALIDATPGTPEMSDAEVSAALCVQNISVLGKAPLWQVKQLLLETGRWWALKLAAKTESAIQPVADAAVEIISDPRFENIDMANPVTQQMMGALVQAGIITQEQSDAVVAMATTLTSIAEQAGLGDPTPTDVGMARGTIPMVQTEAKHDN